jgi:hypothetical protein
MRRIALLACGLALAVLPATASAAITTTSDPDTLAAALDGGAAVGTASFEELAGAESNTPHGVGDAALGGFPTAGDTFAILTNGDASLADGDNATEASVSLGAGPAHGFAGADGNANDTSVLAIPFTTPAEANCLSLDFRFLSEEFPDNVGQGVSDGFLAMLDSPAFSTEPATAEIAAPSNFAFDSNGALVSVDTGALSTDAAAGTVYNAATASLPAHRSVTPGSHTLYLAIFDQGDDILDSAVFLDHLTFSTTDTAATCDGPVDRTPPALTMAEPTGTDTGTPTYSGAAGTVASDSRTVRVQVYAGSSVSGVPVDIATATRAEDGTWEATSGGLEPGTYTAQAHQLDTAGNAGVSPARTFTVTGADTTDPTPSIDSPVDGAELSTHTPTISGTAGTAAGDFPEITVGVYEGTEPTDGAVDVEGTTAADDGSFSVTTAPLPNGVYTAIAQQSDSSANAGQSDPVTFRIGADDTAPTVRITSPFDHGATDDTTPLISGTAGDAPGDASQVHVTVRSGATVLQNLNATRSGTAWSVEAGALAPGDYTLVASQTDSGGNTGTSPTITFTVNAPPPPPDNDTDVNTETPQPEQGKSVVAGKVSGTIRIRLKNGKFKTLGPDEEIPLGSTIDATKGRVRLTSAAGGGKTQTADFYTGQFKITQTKGKQPITQLELNGALSCGKAGKASAAAKRKKVRSLWGDGHGRFRTKGRKAAATVRGTKWFTQDRCDSTKITVKRGVVQVRDFVKRKNVTVKKGHSYVAGKKK